MNNITYTHPLDRLMNDNSIFLLEALIPFVDYNMKRLLVVFIKVREINTLMSRLNHPGHLASSGFDCRVKNTDEMIDKMCDFLPPEFAKNIRQTIKMMNMMRIMDGMDMQDMNMSNTDMYNTNSNYTWMNDHGGNREKDTDFKKEQRMNESYEDSNEGLFDSVMSILNDYDSQNNEFDNFDYGHEGYERPEFRHDDPDYEQENARNQDSDYK